MLKHIGESHACKQVMDAKRKKQNMLGHYRWVISNVQIKSSAN